MALFRRSKVLLPSLHSISSLTTITAENHLQSSAVPQKPMITIPSLCSFISASILDGDRSLQSLRPNIYPQDAIAIVALLSETEGSMVALTFFYWAVKLPEIKCFMLFYATTVSSLIGRGNLEKAHEVMRCLIKCFSEANRLKEGVHMDFEMRNQGLKLNVHTMNFALRLAVEMGNLSCACKLFEEMSVNWSLP